MNCPYLSISNSLQIWATFNSEYHSHHVCSEQQRATWGENSCWLGWSRGGRCAGVPPLPHAAAWQGHCPGGKAGADMYSWEFSMFGGNKETICEIFRFILVFCIIYDCDPRMLREISFLQLTPQIEMENVKWSKSSNVHRIQNRIPANLLGLAHKFWINYLFSNGYLLDKDQYLGIDCGLRYFPAKSRDLDLDWHWWTEEADICPHWSPPNCSCPTTSSSSIMMILTMMHRWLSHLRKTISMVFTAIWLDLDCTETPIHRKSGNKNSSELFPTTWLFCLFCFLPLDYSAHCSIAARGRSHLEASDKGIAWQSSSNPTEVFHVMLDSDTFTYYFWITRYWIFVFVFVFVVFHWVIWMCYSCPVGDKAARWEPDTIHNTQYSGNKIQS